MASSLYMMVIVLISKCACLCGSDESDTSFPPTPTLLFLSLLSGGVVGSVSPVKCPQGHVLHLSDLDTGWTCDGQPGEGGPCRGGHHPIRYRCQSCDYDLCHACYEAKGQGIRRARREYLAGRDEQFNWDCF